MFITNKNVRAKSKKNPVAFLSTQKLELIGLLPHPFCIKIIQSKLRESHLANKN